MSASTKKICSLIRAAVPAKTNNPRQQLVHVNGDIRCGGWDHMLVVSCAAPAPWPYAIAADRFDASPNPVHVEAYDPPIDRLTMDNGENMERLAEFTFSSSAKDVAGALRWAITATEAKTYRYSVDCVAIFQDAILATNGKSIHATCGNVPFKDLGDCLALIPTEQAKLLAKLCSASVRPLSVACWMNTKSDIRVIEFSSAFAGGRKWRLQVIGDSGTFPGIRQIAIQSQDKSSTKVTRKADESKKLREYIGDNLSLPVMCDMAGKKLRCIVHSDSNIEGLGLDVLVDTKYLHAALTGIAEFTAWVAGGMLVIESGNKTAIIMGCRRD